MFKHCDYRKVLAALVLVFCLTPVLIFSSKVIALSEEAAEEVVRITGDYAKQLFTVGEEVTIDANVEDELFALGQSVSVKGGKTQTLIVGAEEFKHETGDIRDLILGALNADIKGTIEDDIVAGVCPVCWEDMGRMTIGTDGQIGGDAHIIASVLEIKGKINGDLKAAGRRVFISGEVGGEVNVFGNEIIISKDANISGALTTRGPFKPKIEEGATIGGEIKHVETEEAFPEPGYVAENLIYFAIVMAIVWLLGILLLGILAQVFIPGILNNAVTRVRSQPWANVGYGLAWILLIPVLIWAFFISMIGIPVSAFLFLAFWMMVILAVLAGAYSIGLWLRGTKGDKPEFPGVGGRIGWTVLGLIIFTVIAAIPIVGWILGFLILLSGLGAVAGRMLTVMRET